MEKVTFLSSKWSSGRIEPELEPREIAKIVLGEKRPVILRNVFTEDEMLDVRNSILTWGKERAPAAADDFTDNYHCQRAKVSNIQQSPHVFHDYNFNDLDKLPDPLRQKLDTVYGSMRVLYDELTGRSTRLGISESGPYFHPQMIHYPLGGGFFGRHNHNLEPQQIGFILAMSRYGVDYKGGGTCFEIDGHVVDLEGEHHIGDLCLWRNDLDHWVTQSPLDDKFSWESDEGRFVATLAYFDPR